MCEWLQANRSYVRGDYCIWHFVNIYNSHSRYKNNNDDDNSYGNINHYNTGDDIN